MNEQPMYVLPVDIVKYHKTAGKAFKEHFDRFDPTIQAEVKDGFSQIVRLKHEHEKIWDTSMNGSNTVDMSSRITIERFDTAWSKDILLPYRSLRRFCGTLATPFSHTAGVEGDFSIRKSVYQGRDSLSHFPAQCDMHCRVTFPLIRRLKLFVPTTETKRSLQYNKEDNST